MRRALPSTLDPLVRLTALAFAIALLPASACQRKDPKKCDEAQATSRKAADGKQFAEARQWREFAYKQCDDKTTLGALDQYLSGKEAEVKVAEARQAQAKPLMDLFKGFVTSNRAAPDKAIASRVCPPEGQPDHGWCSGLRTTGGSATIEVRYKETEPGAFRFTAKGPGEGTCAQLAGAAGRTWSVTMRSGGVATRTHCKLSGLDSVVSYENAGGGTTVVTLASPSFMVADPGLKKQIESEGK